MLHKVCHKSQLSEVSFLYNFFSGKAINIENETQSTDIKNDKNRNENRNSGNPISWRTLCEK
jgi:hypothetical protein